MEFKLNKIDPDVRRQVNEATKEGRIHGADHNISVKKDKKQEHRKYTSKDKMESSKRIFVNAIKKQNFEIEVFSEENGTEKEIKGRFLDIRK